jgi:nucleotide-binding universal stress UspA family protein
MYANILLSTDGSEVARKGVEHGLALAKALKAKVTVITVTEPLASGHGGGHGAWIPPQELVDGFDAAQKERAAKLLNDIRATAEQAGISADVVHIPNSHHPASDIIATAKAKSCDVIVMSSHGHRGLKKLVLGSQTSAVLADGSVPVLVVR